MKYSIKIDQKAVVDAGYDLDLTDMAIFDVLSVYTNSTKCKRMNEGGDVFFNVPYQIIIDELPIAKIKKTDSVYRRFLKLEQYGIVAMHPDNKRLKQVWFTWGRNYEKLHFDQTGLKSDQNPARPELNRSVTGSKSDIRPDKNPALNYTNHYTLTKSEHTPAQNASSTLETELSKKEIMPPPPAAPPNWEGLPNANTAQEFQSELSRFYTQWPQEWRNVKEATPAMNWDNKKQIEVLTRFCTWAITEGWERRNFKKINARLRQWFKDEPLMGRVPINQVTPAATLPGNIPTTGKR